MEGLQRGAPNEVRRVLKGEWPENVVNSAVKNNTRAGLCCCLRSLLIKEGLSEFLVVARLLDSYSFIIDAVQVLGVLS